MIYSKQDNNQYNIGIVMIESIVVPSVIDTAFSVSPQNSAANVEASPAVGMAKAIKNPSIK